MLSFMFKLISCDMHVVIIHIKSFTQKKYVLDFWELVFLEYTKQELNLIAQLYIDYWQFTAIDAAIFDWLMWIN